MQKNVLCIGEVLWDSLPDGLFLGGAPFNVACHLHQQGIRTHFVSRVGKDELGREIRIRMERFGLDSSYLQEDETLGTGFVRISLKKGGIPGYDILKPSAWDRIEITPEIEELVRNCAVVVFGSLAQRDAVSRNSIQQIVNDIPYKVFDINLRPPYDYFEVIKESLELANIVKLNDDEFELLKDWFDLSDSKDPERAFMELFSLIALCVTYGESGAVLHHQGQRFQVPGIKVSVEDTVGAGDAFLATMIGELLVKGTSPEESLNRANLTAAFVASRRGAIPQYEKNDIFDLHLTNQELHS